MKQILTARIHYSTESLDRVSPDLSSACEREANGRIAHVITLNSFLQLTYSPG